MDLGRGVSTDILDGSVYEVVWQLLPRVAGSLITSKIVLRHLSIYLSFFLSSIYLYLPSTYHLSKLENVFFIFVVIFSIGNIFKVLKLLWKI